MERQPNKEGELPLQLYGKSIDERHAQLTGDDLDVPASRYGRKASEAAWWALASSSVFERYGTVDDESLIDNMLEAEMSMAVNDYDGVEENVREHLEAVRVEILENLTLDGEPAVPAPYLIDRRIADADPRAQGTAELIAGELPASWSSNIARLAGGDFNEIDADELEGEIKALEESKHVTEQARMWAKWLGNWVGANVNEDGELKAES